MITESWFSLEFVKTLIWIKKHGLPGRSKFCMLWHRQSGKSQLKSGHEVCSSSIWCKTSLEAKSGWAIYEGCQQEFIDWLSCGFRAFWFSISSGNLIGYEKKKLAGKIVFFFNEKKRILSTGHFGALAAVGLWRWNGEKLFHFATLSIHRHILLFHPVSLIEASKPILVFSVTESRGQENRIHLWEV